MDMFFDCISDPRKKRVHFNAFMLDVHRKIHHWRQHERRSVDEDPITPVAQKIRREASLLCFDEFQVTDVADAMILKRLFGQMLDHGLRIVTTSNRPPSELYKGGLNRPLFEPFISG
jgi:predicted ATPase